MKLSERHQLYVLILVFLLILGGEGVYAYFCLEERSGLREQLNALDLAERDGKEKVALIPQLREEAKQMAAIIEEYVTILPSDEEARYEAFLVDIDNFARDAGLELLSGSGEQVQDSIARKRSGRNQDAKTEQKNNFVRHRYRFKLRGQFLNFLKFMNHVENHRRYLRIDEFRLRPINSEDQDRGLEEIVLAEDPRKEIEVVISTYTYSKPPSSSAEKKKK